MSRFPLQKCVVFLTALLGLGPATGSGAEYIKPNDATGSSLAVVIDPVPLAHTTQFLPLDERGEIVGRGDVRRQTEKVLSLLDAALRRANASLSDVVKLNISATDPQSSALISSVLAQHFSGPAKPAVAFVGGELAHPDALIAIDAVSVSRLKTSGTLPVQLAATNSKRSQVAVLPPGGVVYVSGLADRSELGAATKVTLEKIVSAIGHLKLHRRDIVQLKAFLRPMTQVKVAERAMEEYFADAPLPPVVFVEWISSGAPIEIEAVVSAPASDSDRKVTHHNTPNAPASPVFSRLARFHAGKRIYISGLYGTSEREADVKDIFGQLETVLSLAGGRRDGFGKATYYYSEPASNARLDAFRPTYFEPAAAPAASKARVRNVGAPGKGIMIDMIAGGP